MTASNKLIFINRTTERLNGKPGEPMANDRNNTYTLAQRDKVADAFRPVPGLPRNMTIQQARAAADIARANGFDVVAFNVAAE